MIADLRSIGAAIMLAAVVCSFGPAAVTVASEAGQDAVLVVTSAPYLDVSAISDRFVEAGYLPEESLHVEQLVGDFPQSVRQLESFFSKHSRSADRWTIVAVGGSALPLRWLLANRSTLPVTDVVHVAAPNAGSVSAEMLYGETLVGEVLNYRSDRDMHRRSSDPRWSRPEFQCAVSYLAHRSRGLFEPLYHNFLIEEQLSLSPTGPESARSFFGWLAYRHPGRLQGYFLESETPIRWDGGLQQLQVQAAGRTLSWAYFDVLAATVARFTYTTSESAVQALTDDLLGDVPVVRDWRTALIEFGRRRLVRFARNYLLPRLSTWTRLWAVQWFQRQLELDAAVLLYQIPKHVSIPWSDTALSVPANQLLQDLTDVEFRSPRSVAVEHAVVVESPNWLQLIDSRIGPNDWWTEVKSSAVSVCPRGEVRRVFLPLGGGVGGSGRVAAAVVSCLETAPVSGYKASGAESQFALDNLSEVIGDALWEDTAAVVLEDPKLAEPEESTTSPESIGPVEDGDAAAADDALTWQNEDGDEVPQIRAVYRNKNTTLKSERRVVHSYWLWDFGDGTQEVDDSSRNTQGKKTHEFPGPGRYEVSAVSHASDGSILRSQKWSVDIAEDADDYREAFAYATAEEVIPEIELTGPRAWVTGRPAHYQMEVEVQLPEQIYNLQVVCYPGCEFEAIWERPGQFWVKGAANLRYSWRFPDGSSRHFSVIYVEEKPVEVMTTSLLYR